MVVGVVDVVDVKYCYDESGRMFRRGDLIDDSNINPRGIMLGSMNVMMNVSKNDCER